MLKVAPLLQTTPKRRIIDSRLETVDVGVERWVSGLELRVYELLIGRRRGF